MAETPSVRNGAQRTANKRQKLFLKLEIHCSHESVCPLIPSRDYFSKVKLAAIHDSRLRMIAQEQASK
jgi:hypothetical protein